MKRHQIVNLVALALLVVAPLTAEAAGEVQGVTAPSTATKGTPVTITVTGKDDECKSLDLDFGDGTTHGTYTGPLPKNFVHTYTTTGNKTITAKGVDKCKGQASTSVMVNAPPGGGIGGLAGLCQTINCMAPYAGCLTPKIAQADSPITPGGAVVIKGCGFGELTGELWLTGLKSYQGLALAPVKLTIPPSKPPWDFWQSKFVVGLVPDSITHVKDQPAKLQIKTHSNVLSNEFPVNFVARRDVVVLPCKDPAVQVVSCSNDANWNVCNNFDPDKPISWNDPCLVTTCTFYGMHYNCWGCIGDDSGSDTFQITLKNGWVFESMSYRTDFEAGEASVAAPSPALPVGANVWQPSVSWIVTPADHFNYWASVTITGPTGVPW